MQGNAYRITAGDNQLRIAEVLGAPYIENDQNGTPAWAGGIIQYVALEVNGVPLRLLPKKFEAQNTVVEAHQMGVRIFAFEGWVRQYGDDTITATIVFDARTGQLLPHSSLATISEHLIAQLGL